MNNQTTTINITKENRSILGDLKFDFRVEDLNDVITKLIEVVKREDDTKQTNY